MNSSYDLTVTLLSPFLKVNVSGMAVSMPKTSNGCNQRAVGRAGHEAGVLHLRHDVGLGQLVAASRRAAAFEQVARQEADMRVERVGLDCGRRLLRGRGCGRLGENRGGQGREREEKGEMFHDPVAYQASNG